MEAAKPEVLQASANSEEMNGTAPTIREGPAPASPPFSAFNKHDKWIIMVLVSWAGFFSPITANIYFPAIPTLSDAFHTSVSSINLTVTVYMLSQGVSPLLWAPIADIRGRRPVYIACLSILALSCVGLAEIPTDKWWLLMVLRVIQAAGSASTLAVNGGVVSDLALPSERGGLMGITGIGTMLGPSLGPVIGGLLAGQLGWRWIFWFLCILTCGCLVFIVLLLPETLRSMVGNGSIKPPLWDRPLIPAVTPWRRPASTATSSSLQTIAPPRSALSSYKNLGLLFLQPDVNLILLANGAAFALFMIIPASIAVLFKTAYPYLSETEVGLCYLPIGISLLISSPVSGKIANVMYGRDRAKWEKGRTFIEGEKGPIEIADEDSFPIEWTRLKLTYVNLGLLVVCAIAYGWCVHQRVFLAVPLLFLVGVGWPAIALMNSYGTLLIDLFPKQGSSTAAAGNIFRCTMGAILVSILNPMLTALGAGWTFVLLGGVGGMIVCTATWVVVKNGERWRRKRHAARLS